MDFHRFVGDEGSKRNRGNAQGARNGLFRHRRTFHDVGLLGGGMGFQFEWNYVLSVRLREKQ